MPLFVVKDGKRQKFEETLTFDELFDEFPHLTDVAKSFHAKPKIIVGPVGLLYIGQREMAVTSNRDENVHTLGSEDATTCHILILRHSTGVVGLSHLDGVDTHNAIMNMVLQIRALTYVATSESPSQYNAHIYGGFSDEGGQSLKLSRDIIQSLQSCSEDIVLQEACMTHKNTCVKDGIIFPIVYGVALNIQSGEIFPATFPDKGPDIPLRSARHSSVDNVISIYDSHTGQIVVNPFDFAPLPYAEKWLEAPRHVILKYLSTSPQQEPDDFVDNVKRTIEFTMTMTKDEVFRNDAPRIHSINTDGKWILQ